MKKIALSLVLAGGLAAFLGAAVQGRVEGKVTDASGAPLEKVAVSIVSQITTAIRFSVTTDGAGKFAQIGLQPGYYVVSFKKDGYAPVSKEIHVAIEESTRLEVVLQKAAPALDRTLSESDQLFLKGNKLYAEQDYAGAETAYKEAIAKLDDQWGYYLNLGLAEKKLDKKDEAKAAFAKAVELNPDSYSANKEYGEVLAKAGDFEEAKTYYRKATELSPTDPDAFYNLGACLANLGDNENALAAYQKCVALKPDYAEAYYQIGTIDIGLNKKDEAIASLEKFLELAPAHEKAGLARQLLDYLKK
jgi:tetratricopeptide (TPR) repeat protein